MNKVKDINAAWSKNLYNSMHSFKTSWNIARSAIYERHDTQRSWDSFLVSKERYKKYFFTDHIMTELVLDVRIEKWVL